MDRQVDDVINKAKSDKAFRKNLAKQSFSWFFLLYLNHYVRFLNAPFHHKIYALAEDEQELLSVIVAFRGSGKSTIMSLAYPIWAILGKQQKKFCLIINLTQPRAQETLSHIREEFESNKLLNRDFGPFVEEGFWRDNTLNLSRYSARITAASTNENIRGIRNRFTRPDLIILDDIEDISTTRTKESRDKNWRFINSEVFPTGDINTKKIIIGNLVHEDSVISRLKLKIEDKKINGSFNAFPLIDNNNEIAWEGKFKDLEAIERFKKNTVGNDIDWSREYLLKILPDTDQVVHPEWIQYYSNIPKVERNIVSKTGVGVDLAISQSDSADFTAIVTARLHKASNEESRIFIDPNPFNRRVTFPETIEQINFLSSQLGGHFMANFYVESNQYQDAVAQDLKTKGIVVEGVKAQVGKRERLAAISHWIKSGKILFPEKGCELLIEQILGFGIEKHDDLMDAFTLVCIKLIEFANKPEPRMRILYF